MSEYECREVARFVLVQWDQWLAMDEDSRAKAIAHCRLNHAVEANVMDAYTRAHERRSRRRR